MWWVVARLEYLDAYGGLEDLSRQVRDSEAGAPLSHSRVSHRRRWVSGASLGSARETLIQSTQPSFPNGVIQRGGLCIVNCADLEGVSGSGRDEDTPIILRC
jgi:hypothetical protein